LAPAIRSSFRFVIEVTRPIYKKIVNTNAAEDNANDNIYINNITGAEMAPVKIQLSKIKRF
jgi:hypothetical protein